VPYNRRGSAKTERSEYSMLAPTRQDAGQDRKPAEPGARSASLDRHAAVRLRSPKRLWLIGLLTPRARPTEARIACRRPALDLATMGAAAAAPASSPRSNERYGTHVDCQRSGMSTATNVR
jgi:hypothetical protein